MKDAIDFQKYPYKHPAVWKWHLVKMTSGNVDGVAISTASSECGWIVCSRFNYRGHLAQSTAINEHWYAVIAEAEAEAVPA